MKRIVSMMLAVIMVLSMMPCAVAAGSRDVSYEETLAADLKELGLFKGVSDTNFGLGRAPSRIEALVMLVRLLGKEQEALNGPWQHPFTDVPQWASPYVGYAYAHGLTKGVSATTFGSGDANAQTYLTFMLRALGYSDTNGADFTWDSPYALATELGILFDLVDLDNFWRADVVLVSYAALPVRLKDSRQTLADKLIDGYLTEKFDEVWIIYTSFLNMMSQEVQADRLLPVEKTEEDPARTPVDTIYELEPMETLMKVMPDYLSGRLYSALCDSFASEVSARRTAMDSATKNAGEMISDLKLKFNRARQGAITQEITEIVAGAEQ